MRTLRRLAVAAAVIAVAAPGVRAVALPAPLCGKCEAWTAKYDEGSSGDVAEAVTTSPDGTVTYITGTVSHSGTGFDMLTAAYSTTTGALKWAARYNGPANGDDRGVAIAVSPDGSRVFVAGTSAGGATQDDMVTAAYNAASGGELWTRRYDGPKHGTDFTQGAALSADGTRFMITGYSGDLAALPNYDAATIAYDTANGAVAWSDRYEGAARFWDIPTGVSTASGRTFVTMRSNVTSTANEATDFVTVAYGPTGVRLWEARYDAPAHNREYPYAIAVSPDGNRVYVTGESIGMGFDYATIAYDAATGAQVWARRYDGKAGFDDRPLAVAVNPVDGTVYVTGFSFDSGIPGDRRTATVAYAPDGTQRWAQRHGTPVGAAGVDLAASRDGRRVYVAGLTIGQAIAVNQAGLELDTMETVAYDASGAEVWSADIAGTGTGRGVTVTPDSRRVLVAGGGQDALLAAYDS